MIPRNTEPDTKIIRLRDDRPGVTRSGVWKDGTVDVRFDGDAHVTLDVDIYKVAPVTHHTVALHLERAADSLVDAMRLLPDGELVSKLNTLYGAVLAAGIESLNAPGQHDPPASLEPAPPAEIAAAIVNAALRARLRGQA